MAQNMTRGAAVLCAALLVGVLSSPPPAQAWPTNATDAANCHKKDGQLLKIIGDEFNAFSKKYKNFDEQALKKDPQKYCRWLTDTVFQLRKRNLARLEARLKDDHCGPDVIMVTNYEYGMRQFAELKRRMSGPCMGLKDE
ncbi:MAG: hypothetical protein WCG00_17085 [Hyphomicrobiales bacterium]